MCEGDLPGRPAAAGEEAGGDAADPDVAGGFADSLSLAGGAPGTDTESAGTVAARAEEGGVDAVTVAAGSAAAAAPDPCTPRMEIDPTTAAGPSAATRRAAATTFPTPPPLCGDVPSSGAGATRGSVGIAADSPTPENVLDPGALTAGATICAEMLPPSPSSAWGGQAGVELQSAGSAGGASASEGSEEPLASAAARMLGFDRAACACDTHRACAPLP